MRAFDRDEALDDRGACVPARATRRIEAGIDVADGRVERVAQAPPAASRVALSADSRTSTRSRCFGSDGTRDVRDVAGRRP